MSSTLTERATSHPDADAAAAPAVRRGATIASRATTGLFAVVMTASGISFLLGPPPIVTMIHHLGYPAYFRVLLGVAKLLGVAAVVVPELAPESAPGVPTLREWAYAGFTFLFLAAIASHLLSGDGPGRALPAVVVWALSLASYRLSEQP